MLNARGLPWRLAQAVVCLFAFLPSLAARDNCISIGGVQVLEQIVVAGNTVGVSGPITKCSFGRLRVTVIDEVTDACGEVVGITAGSLMFRNQASDSDTWIRGHNVTIEPDACPGEATLLRAVYGPGQELLATARDVFEIVTP